MNGMSAPRLVPKGPSRSQHENMPPHTSHPLQIIRSSIVSVCSWSSVRQLPPAKCMRSRLPTTAEYDGLEKKSVCGALQFVEPWPRFLPTVQLQFAPGWEWVAGGGGDRGACALCCAHTAAWRHPYVRGTVDDKGVAGAALFAEPYDSATLSA